MRTLILSDLHLGSKHSSVDLLAKVLDEEKYDRLVLNGDTIHNVNLRKMSAEHWRMLDRLRLIGKSRELVLLRGNHDHELDHLPGQPINGLGTAHVLPALLEVPMREDHRLDIDGEPYLLMHGDRFDPSMSYPVVTEVAFLCYQLTTKVNKKLAKWLKRKSKRWGGVLDVVRRHAVAHAHKADLAGMIVGHTHFAEDCHVENVHYVNSGSWTESPCSYLIAEPQRIGVHYVAE